MSTTKRVAAKAPSTATVAKPPRKPATAAGKSGARKTAAKPRRDTLNLRIQPAERNLIDHAAAVAGKTRTDFILDAARKAAESALLDRAILAVGTAAYDEFLRRLDAPARPNERLRETMQTPPPWER